MSVNKRTRLNEVTKILVRTALGEEKADLVLKNGTLVNVNTGELLEKTDVAVKRDRIALVGRAEHTIGPETKVVDVSGKYLAPGFIDGHVHVESAMLTLTQFARAVLPHGTTTAFIDSHELANVLGLRAVQLMIEEAKKLPLRIFVALPSCVPAAPSFETSGAILTPKDIQRALHWDGVAALGEMMNYPGVLAGEDAVHREIGATLKEGKVVEGHCVDLLGKELAAYVAAGITSCHESTRKIQAVEKLRLGMYAMLREGSSWRDVAETIRCVTEDGLDPRHVVLVTDDSDPDSIINQGHMNHVVRRAVEEGVDPITAIQMATINAAEHFEFSREIGSVAPARFADINILDDLSKVSVSGVVAGGVIVAKNGRLTIDIQPPSYPNFVRKSIKLGREPAQLEFRIKAPKNERSVRVRVIGAIPGSAYTESLEEELEVKNGYLESDTDKDVLKIFVFERHNGSGNNASAFVKGFKLARGAVASTVAHDCHNLIVMGTGDRDMLVAADRLIKMGGGMNAVLDGRPIAEVPLTIAGIVSDQPVEKVAEQVHELQAAWEKLGCNWSFPYMTTSLLTLSVIPKLRITDKGLLDTVKFRFVDLIVK